MFVLVIMSCSVMETPLPAVSSGSQDKKWFSLVLKEPGRVRVLTVKYRYALIFLPFHIVTQRTFAERKEPLKVGGIPFGGCGG